jgi:glyoxylase-like metal-dependent hydrolase (beta-lactamase superfamily II)
MLDVITIPVSVFAQNCRIIGCTVTKQAVILDPGGEPDRIVERFQSTGYSCVGVWLTHSHLDHCGGVQELLSHFDVPLLAHPVEEMMRSHVEQVAAMYGLPPGHFANCPEPTKDIRGGETLPLGQHLAQVLFVPGHSPGHVVFYFREDATLFGGDCLFKGSIGRTDLPGGDHEQLLASIRTSILTLPDETKVLSGHGPDTTVGAERATNPFLV